MPLEHMTVPVLVWIDDVGQVMARFDGRLHALAFYRCDRCGGLFATSTRREFEPRYCTDCGAALHLTAHSGH